MKIWEVALEWGNQETTHVLAIGETAADAHKHAVKHLPELCIDNLASVEVLDQIDNSNQAKAIIDLLKQFKKEGADSISFGALVNEWETIGQMLQQLLERDEMFKNCTDW